jgi:hypothetical protein
MKVQADRRDGLLLGRAAARNSLYRGYRAEAGVGLQAVNRDDLLPLDHLDGECLGPLGEHQEWAGKRADRGFCWPPKHT